MEVVDLTMAQLENSHCWMLVEVDVVAHWEFPCYYGSLGFQKRPCDQKVFETLQTEVPIVMTLHSEHHSTKDLQTQLDWKSSVPRPRHAFARLRERRSEQPVSPQGGTCWTTDLTLQTSTGRSRNPYGLIVSGFETPLNQAGTTRSDCGQFALATGLELTALHWTTVELIRLSLHKIDEAIEPLS